MKNDKIKKCYFRFLKEYGVYQRGLSVHKKAMCSNALTFDRLFATDEPIFWVQDTTIFCTWTDTPEGDIFWWAISLLWQSECVINDHSYFTAGKKYTIESLLISINDYICYYNKSILNPRSTVEPKKIEELKNKLSDNENKLNLIWRKEYCF